MASRHRTQLLLGRAQWSALRHPRRLDILMAIEAHAPCSIAELADALQSRPAGLYRHVRLLTAAGFLRQAGRKPVGKRWASLYDRGPYLSANHVHAPSGRGLREHGEMVLALVRPAGRAYLHGVLSQRGQAQAAMARRCSAMFERTWLDAAAQARVKRLVRALYKIVERGRRTRRGERFQISLMSAPTAGRTRSSIVARPPPGRSSPEAAPRSGPMDLRRRLAPGEA